MLHFYRKGASSQVILLINCEGCLVCFLSGGNWWKCFGLLWIDETEGLI